MGTETFLNNLKRYAERFSESQQIPDEFFGYFKSNYDIYVSATPEERERIREFVRHPPQEDKKPKSFFEKLFQSKQKTIEISGLLILYVIRKALPQLESTGDDTWLISGLVAISMENCDSDWRDTLTFLQDLYQTAETKGIDPNPHFLKIAEVSSNQSQQYVDTPMDKMMAKIEWFKSKEN